MYKYLLIVLSIFLLFGCKNNENEPELFHYKNSNVGDNSAVVSIMNELPLRENVDTISLKTAKEPYSIALHFKNQPIELSQKEFNKIILSNTAYLFTLIHNVQNVQFIFPDYTIAINRYKLEKWLNVSLKEIENEEAFKKKVEHVLNDEMKVQQYFDSLN